MATTKNFYEDELAKAASEGNYKQYYNQMLQLYNIGQQANNYMQNSMRQQGLYGTGEGVSYQTAQNNAILNSQNQAFSDYQDRQRAIDTEAYERYMTESANQDNLLASYMQNDPTHASQYLVNQGLMDEQGNWTDDYYALDKNRQTNIQNMYNSIINGLGNNDVMGKPLGDYNQMRENGVTTEANDRGSIGINIGKDLDNESKTMQNFITANYDKANQGVVFELQADVGNGGKAYIYYYNGNYYQISAEQYRTFNGDKYRIAGRTNPIKIAGRTNPVKQDF